MVPTKTAHLKNWSPFRHEKQEDADADDVEGSVRLAFSSFMKEGEHLGTLPQGYMENDLKHVLMPRSACT